MGTVKRENAYQALLDEYKAECDRTLPFVYFETLEERYAIMKSWGLSPSDNDRVCVNLCGGTLPIEYFDDVGKLNHEFESKVEQAIKDDATGDGFVVDMFLYAFEKTGYGEFGPDPDEDTYVAIELGMAESRFVTDPKLKHGFEKAKRIYSDKNWKRY